VPEGFRSMEVAVDTPTGPVTVVVASSTEDRDEPVGVLVASLGVAVPVVVAVLGVVVWLLVGRTLAPVEAMRAEVAEISAERLDRRVPEPGGGDEVQRLARTMNEMLDRLEAADRRLRRFTADASHELRTPLTRMRTELEVDLAGGSGRSPEQLERSLLAEVLHLQAMVEGLLATARLDAGVGGFEPVPVDLDDIVLREAEQSRAALEAAGSTVTLRVSRVSAALVEGDPLQLASVVRNLLDNACRHADSEVEVVLWEQGDSVVLEVSDDGPGVPEPAREVVFEPFGRAEESRSTTGGGPGLGLAIVREVAIRHGGSAELVDRAPGAGARFRVVLPRGSGSRAPLVYRTPVR
jgi:signal transduction histidine kinase